MSLQTKIQSLVQTKLFERGVAAVIVVNAILIGVELEKSSTTVEIAQDGILAIFVLELILRFVGRKSNEEYFRDGWNYFDIFVILIAFVPPDIAGNAEVSVLRTLRVLRVFKLLREVEELRLITSVLLRSIKSLGYCGLLFLIFIYVYAVIGVSLFKVDTLQSVPQWSGNPQWLDPYGSLGEAMFTLFRILTGAGWTDLRYNLLRQNPNIDTVVTVYHVSWMVLSGFLLINLVVGAVVNNYNRAMAEVQAERAEKTERERAAKRKEQREEEQQEAQQEEHE